ncbi:probable 39S ribosomal protein L24, mitochondrial [Agrilus planipennis]|uniref:Large ribosomal subunit protein uL24m n=1 Tax=Agrilus planipennis TaxID=224129 RepID=A0A1W4XLB8_AGRPL|nr:probable 39S ribosomal protein L24, mitochondrial [Agrilus planipennis]XP_018333572.1 probable 39S ribosomal protein L24, mitochondrial [Agrilus planipennis]
MKLTGFLMKVQKWSKQYSNLPDRYIKRAMQQIYWKNPKGIQYRTDAVIERKKFRFTMNRPWTAQFRQQNAPGVLRKKVFVEPILNWCFFRGDRVEVLEGKDKGKQGIVKQIIQERNWVVVEGLNCHFRRIGADKEFSGVCIKSEAPLLVTTQVALVDPSDLKATSIEWRYTEEGEHVRVSTRTGRIIPIPATNSDTIDYKTKSTYKEQPKDTTEKEVGEITFEPALKTFEMDIMDKMGIKEDRIPPKTYWY